MKMATRWKGLLPVPKLMYSLNSVQSQTCLIFTFPQPIFISNNNSPFFFWFSSHSYNPHVESVSLYELALSIQNIYTTVIVNLHVLQPVNIPSGQKERHKDAGPLEGFFSY
ncbi:hypothetical protein CRENBAI_015756 [Crenichthys baileyi]|uniref:Uncharacterized protein n=1 Tax=Crenichthys baileyi TaxID=28760 RepID=A0AAV9S6M6_9TELE